MPNSADSSGGLGVGDAAQSMTKPHLALERTRAGAKMWIAYAERLVRSLFLQFEKAREVLDDLVRHLLLNIVATLNGLMRDDV